MKISFLGDSITAGAGASKPETCFVERVGQFLGCKVNNYGVCGTRIAKQTIPSENPIYDNDFNQRAKSMDLSADFVFVFGGTNDYGHGDALLGNIDDNTESTFCGALNCLIDYLLSVFNKEKICFILPLHRYNEDSIYGEGLKKTACYKLSDYVNCEIQIFNKYGVNYLDLREFFPIPTVNNGDELTVDGLHPNDFGHKIIAEQVCNYLKTK